jgi:hypothetical protein
MRIRDFEIVNGAEGPVICPAVWAKLLHRLFGASQRLSKRLWASLYPSESQQILYDLARAQDIRLTDGNTDEAIAVLLRHVTPRLLTALVARLVVPGQPRSRELRMFEERVLAWTNVSGDWKD